MSKRFIGARQTTLAREVVLSGAGVHSGAPVTVVLHPAEADTGFRFMVSKRGRIVADIPAEVSYVKNLTLCTVIGDDAGTASSIALRGVSHRERGDWEAAAADFYTAYRYDTDDSHLYLVAWAEAQLRLPLDTAAQGWWPEAATRSVWVKVTSPGAAASVRLTECGGAKALHVFSRGVAGESRSGPGTRSCPSS